MLLPDQLSTPLNAVLKCLNVQHLVFEPLSQLYKWVDNLKLQVVQIFLQIRVFAVFKEQLFLRQLLLVRHVSYRTQISVDLWRVSLHGVDLVLIQELVERCKLSIIFLELFGHRVYILTKLCQESLHLFGYNHKLHDLGLAELLLTFAEIAFQLKEGFVPFKYAAWRDQFVWLQVLELFFDVLLRVQEDPKLFRLKKVRATSQIFDEFVQQVASFCDKIFLCAADYFLVWKRWNV